MAEQQMFLGEFVGPPPELAGPAIDLHMSPEHGVLDERVGPPDWLAGEAAMGVVPGADDETPIMHPFQEQMGPPAELAELRRAGLLHDLGKLSIPNSILDKPDKLTPEEWELVRLHPFFTQCVLERIRGFGPLALVAGSHHERLDGRGYHRQLRGDQIPRGGRVLAVADMYEALTADRPYRPAMPEETALAILEKERAVGLDPDCLDALLATLGRAGRDAAERAA